MLEIAPGIYTSPSMSRGVRERIWAVLTEWYYTQPIGSVLMTWQDKESPSGQQIQSLGFPKKSLEVIDDVCLVFTPAKSK